MPAQNSALDPDALRAKYREERDKRLRPDGNEQYVEVAGDFAHYLDDPWVEPGFTRPSMHDEVEVLIIGGGFGGLLTGAKLREAGVRSIRFVDCAGDFGGTWYWNRYPGIACDIESYIYLPLLEETGYMPKSKYADGPEILEHHRRIARHYDLHRDALFQTKVEGLRWDEEAKRWIVATNRGDRIRAHFVAMALGPLNRPKLPGIPGIADFEGHSFHACRWDFAYTGGDSYGNLTGLRGKRVGIIGTGATAVQVVPHVAEAAEHLYVFQRTPSSVDVKNNTPTDPAWAKSLKPGWQQQRMDNFNILVTGGEQPVDLVGDNWTEIFRKLVVGVDKRDLSFEERQRELELADFQKMEEIRARVDATVKDPVTAEALKPYYRQFCKRPCIHNEYLPTFNRPNVTLVDTSASHGVERITKKGVLVGGKEYEVDCLIYASGFEFGTSYTRRAGYDIVGRNGQSIAKKWAEGFQSLHGFHVHGFPNCFIISTTQSGLAANFVHALSEQSKHLAYIIKTAIDRRAQTVEATAEAEREWVSKILGLFQSDFLQNCTPGYYNNEGKPSERSARDGVFGGGPVEFIRLLEEWRAEGKLQGLEIA